MQKSRQNIFVSSTSQDLRSYRRVVKDALLTGGVFPIVQEHFPPDHRDLAKFLEDQIGECDAMICLVGFAFGAAPHYSPGEQPRSYSQIEYDVASRLGKRIYLFMAAPGCLLEERPQEDIKLELLQKEHREALERKHKWTPFASPEELRLRVAELIPTLYAPESSGNQPFHYLHPPAPPAFFAGRQDELQELTDVLGQAHPCMVVVSGVGGQGKTTLVAQWLKEHEPAGFAAGFWCTAYRGGFTFDMFLDTALAYMTRDTFAKHGFEDPVARAQKLIELLQARPMIIIVDGVERWLRGWNQANADLYSAKTVGERVGYFPALDDFLSLASGIRNGTHVVLTTRALPAVLDDAEISVVPVGEPGRRFPLAGLNDDDAVALLRSIGATGEFAELREAARGYANHPLALTVFGRLLAKRYGGKLRPLGDEGVLDPKLRLFQLLEETRMNLPGRERAERFLQVASHSFENPSFEMVSGVLTMLQNEEPGILTSLMGRLFQFPKNSAEPDQLDMVVTLADWQLLVWDGVKGVLTVHPVIKSFFVERAKDSKGIHRNLAQWYSEQLISLNPVSMDHARPRLLSIEHAVRAGEVKWAADMMFAPFTVSQTFYDWLSEWGHLSVGITLLAELARVAKGELRGQLLLAGASLNHQLGCPQKSLGDLVEAIEIFSAGGKQSKSQSLTNLARALASRGNVYRETNSSLRALADFDRALEVFQRLSSQETKAQLDLGKTFINRGNALLDLGHWTRALSDYDQAVTIYRRIGEAQPKLGDPLLADALTNRGIVLAEMERDDGGIRDFNDAIALYMDHQEQGDHQVGLRLAHVRTMLGTKLNDQGQNEEALGHFNKAVAALEPMVAGGRQDAGFHLALALMDRARAGIAVGSFESALDDCLRAITMYEGLVAEDRPHFEGSLGHAYLIRAEVRHAVGDFAGSTTDRIMGLSTIRRLTQEWPDESDIRLVFLQRGLSAVKYLLPVNPKESIELLLDVIDEIKRAFEKSGPAEAIVYEARRVAASLERLMPELTSAGFKISEINNLIRVVRPKDSAQSSQGNVDPTS